MKPSKHFLLTVVAALALLSVNTGKLSAQDSIKKEPEFKPSGKIWGYVFGDYYDKIHADSINRGSAQYSNVPEKMNSFDLRRVYLGYDYNISKKFSTELLIAYEGQTLSDNATRTFFLKAANIRWKNIYKNADLVVGQCATPSFPMMSEKFWGYRSIEKTITDMRKVSSSNDVGITIQGKFDNDGNFGYNLMVGNGSAQKLETDVYKKYYGDVWAKFLNKKLVVDLYADHEGVKDLPGFHKSKTAFKLFVGYTTDQFTVGAEAFEQIQNDYVVVADSVTAPKSDTTSANAFGLSVFVRGSIIKDKLGYFARYDMYNPDTKFNADKVYTTGGAPVTESFITAGVDYTPIKNVHIMPNIWYNGFSSRQKNVTGSTKADYDLVGRLTFYYVFK